MGATIKIFKKIDEFLTSSEKWISGIGLLTILVLILFGVFLRTFFRFTFSWLEEICKYFMVWLACIGSVLSVRNNEHVGVDVVFSIIPKKFHNFYRIILTFICAAFLVFFTRFSIDLTLKVRATGQTSIAMPWLQMYILYAGVAIGNLLLLYEYAKLFIKLLMECFRIKNKNAEAPSMTDGRY